MRPHSRREFRCLIGCSPRRRMRRLRRLFECESCIMRQRTVPYTRRRSIPPAPPRSASPNDRDRLSRSMVRSMHRPQFSFGIRPAPDRPGICEAQPEERIHSRASRSGALPDRGWTATHRSTLAEHAVRRTVLHPGRGDLALRRTQRASARVAVPRPTGADHRAVRRHDRSMSQRRLSLSICTMPAGCGHGSAFRRYGPAERRTRLAFSFPHRERQSCPIEIFRRPPRSQALTGFAAAVTHWP